MADMWRWVDEVFDQLRKDGHHRLAELIQDIPAVVCDGDHLKADALMPEAIALAQAAHLPWLEVFFGHWSMQSRVLQRLQGETALSAAVSLVERAHHDDAMGCPQRICTVQDLAACYAAVDGPGFAAERKAVVTETLAVINESWPCFTCLSAEYAHALLDENDPAGCLAFVDGQERRLRAKNVDSQPHDFWSARFSALISLQRLDEAAAVLDACDQDALHRNDEDNTLRKCSRALARAEVLLMKGDPDGAAHHLLPQLGVIEAELSLWRHFARVWHRWCSVHVQANDDVTGLMLLRCAQSMFEVGSWSIAIEIAFTAGELALLRGDASSSADALQIIDQSRLKLRDPGRIDNARAQLARRITP